jgi:hypothetical protein
MAGRGHCEALPRHDGITWFAGATEEVRRHPVNDDRANTVVSIAVDGEVSESGSFDVSTGSVDEVLTWAGPIEAATHATVVGSDGYRASIPLPMLHTGGRLAVDEGVVSLRVVDGTTLCWNVKRVARIEVSIGKRPDSVPEKPEH